MHYFCRRYLRKNNKYNLSVQYCLFLISWWEGWVLWQIDSAKARGRGWVKMTSTKTLQFDWECTRLAAPEKIACGQKHQSAHCSLEGHCFILHCVRSLHCYMWTPLQLGSLAVQIESFLHGYVYQSLSPFIWNLPQSHSTIEKISYRVWIILKFFVAKSQSSFSSALIGVALLPGCIFTRTFWLLHFHRNLSKSWWFKFPTALIPVTQKNHETPSISNIDWKHNQKATNTSFHLHAAVFSRNKYLDLGRYRDGVQ